MVAIGGFDAGAIHSRMVLSLRDWTKNVMRVLKDTKGIKKGFDDIGRGVRNAGLQIAAGGAAITLLSRNLINMAANAQESENLFEVSMGRMADSARAWSEELSSSLGLNAFEVRRMSGMFNVMIKSMGLSETQAFSTSKALTQLTLDMASLYNIRIEEAFVKLTSGISGEVEPLRRLGIIVNVASAEQSKYAQALGKTFKQMTEGEKVMSRFSTIMAQTTAAQGDLARTAGNLVNMNRRMTAMFDEVRIKLGTMLLPSMTRAVNITVNLLEAFSALIDLNPELTKKIILSASASGVLMTAFGALLIMSGLLIQSLGVVAVAFLKLGRAAIWLAATPIRALIASIRLLWLAITGPVGAVVLAIAAVGIAIVSLRAMWKQNTLDMQGAWKDFTDSIKENEVIQKLNKLQNALKGGIVAAAARAAGGAVGLVPGSKETTANRAAVLKRLQEQGRLDLAKNLGSEVKLAAGLLKKEIKGGLTTPAFAALLDNKKIQEATKGAVETAQRELSVLPEAFRETFMDMFQVSSDALKPLFGTIKDGLGESIGAMKTQFIEDFESIKGLDIPFVDDIKEKAEEIFGNMKEMGSNLIDKATSWIDKIVKLSSKTAEGVKSTNRAVREEVKKTAQAIDFSVQKTFQSTARNFMMIKHDYRNIIRNLGIQANKSLKTIEDYVREINRLIGIVSDKVPGADIGALFEKRGGRGSFLADDHPLNPNFRGRTSRHPGAFTLSQSQQPINIQVHNNITPQDIAAAAVSTPDNRSLFGAIIQNEIMAGGQLQQLIRGN